MQKQLIIDFDSTLVTVESLDLLAEIVLKSHPDKETKVSEIKHITTLGMEGKIDFRESLRRRIALFTPRKKNITELTDILVKRISDSVLKNSEFFRENADDIYIISGGFKEFILPVAEVLGISENHILANDFLWKDGVCIGFDETNLLSQKGGKVLAVKALNLEGKIVVIGDGYTDFEIKQYEESDIFIAFTENVTRASVVSEADFVAENFDQVINYLKNN